MALYLRRFGEDSGSPVLAPEAPAAPSPGAAPAPGMQRELGGLGFILGLLPLALVGLAFWAVLAPPPEPKTTYRGRKH